jgi:hypothetical protein
VQKPAHRSTAVAPDDPQDHAFAIVFDAQDFPIVAGSTANDTRPVVWRFHP